MVGTIDLKTKNFLMHNILQRGDCIAYLLKEIEVNYYESLLSFLGNEGKRDLKSHDIEKLRLLFLPNLSCLQLRMDSPYIRKFKGRG